MMTYGNVGGKRGNKFLRCRAKRPMSACADKEQTQADASVFSFSAKAETRRPRPTAQEFIPTLRALALQPREAVQ